MLALPTINTGVFVYQSFILESKNWSEFVIAKSFMFYAIFSVVTLFISGPIVDKYTSRKILPLMNIPSLLAMLILFYSDSYISSYFLFGLMGMAPAGVIMALTADAIKPENRAVGMGVFFSVYFLVQAPAPAIAGWLYDQTADAFWPILFAISLFFCTAVANFVFRLVQKRGSI